MTTTPPAGQLPPPPATTPPSGYPPPPPEGEALPTESYTPWLTRVLAFIIDIIPYAIIVGIGYGIEAATQETACVTDTSEYKLGQFCATGNSTLGVVAFSVRCSWDWPTWSGTTATSRALQGRASASRS